MIDQASRNGRSESEILARAGIPLSLGGVTYYVRPLTMAAAETWEGRIRTLIGAALAGLGEHGAGVDAVLAIGHAAVAAQLDALYAYDDLGEQNALPERDYLFNHASRTDLAEALRKLVQHEFPLLRSAETVSAWIPADLREILGRQLLRIAVESPLAGSSNDSSTNIPAIATRNRAARRSRGNCSS